MDGIRPDPTPPPLLDASRYEEARRRPPPEPAEPEPEPVVLPTRQLVLAAVVLAVCAALLTALLVAILDEDTTVQRVAPPAAPEPGSNRTFDAEVLDIQGVLAKVQPSVVTIETGQTTLRGLFEGAGSGLVVSDDGMILTNSHVIAGADTIEVRFFDGTTAEAELVGSFPDDDIALVQAVSVVGTVPAELGVAADLRVGDEVVAIGNALGLGGSPSVTLGIVSAIDRSIDAGLISLDHLIQTDAAINPGNSGGPLVDTLGRVVGINTAIIDDAQNIGFAISIDAVKPLIDELVAGGGSLTPDTAFLGVTTQRVASVDTAILEQFAVDATDGAFVEDIIVDSAAARAGMARGDVIVAIDGEPVAESEDVARAVRARRPGDVIELTFVRDGTEQTARVTLGARGD